MMPKLPECTPFCLLMVMSAVWLYFLIDACGVWGL
jgi:hypothetical protein